MKKTYGVCLGMLALGLVGIGAPAAHARSLSAAREAGNETAAATASSTTTASSPVDTVLVAENDTKDTAAPTADAPQDQGSPTPANPPQAATPAANAAAPMPLPSPSMAGPLATAVPHEVAAGPLGKLEVTGILSGIGLGEDNEVIPGANMHWDVSNAQIFIQKTTGWLQFYLQGGAYNLPALGTPFAPTGFTVSNIYGPLPQAYLKLVKGNFNVEVGELPTLIGAEYTFSFENMNVERGVLWNQENAVNRGIQLNDTYKKLSVAFSWNDGFFSNRYSWLSGSLTYAFNASNSLSFVGMGNAGAYNKNTAATPLLLNNSNIYNLLYTYTKGPVTITPYYQYTVVKANPTIGILTGAHTNGGAILANYNFKHGVSFAIRPEYIKSSGNVLNPSSINLLYGPGSGAFAFTATPTYVKDGFFLRGDFSVVHATDTTPAFSAFGTTGLKTNQVRGVIEAGFMF